MQKKQKIIPLADRVYEGAFRGTIICLYNTCMGESIAL